MTVRWARKPSALWREGIGRVVLLPATADEPLLLTGSGALLWDLLATPVELDAIARELATCYGVSPEEIAGELATALEDLDAAGAVTTATRESPPLVGGECGGAPQERHGMLR